MEKSRVAELLRVKWCPSVVMRSADLLGPQEIGSAAAQV